MDNMEGVEHRTVKVNGINIHVAEKGKGPVILFLHGFPELWYSWRHQINALSSLGYRAVAPDLRGFGDSDAPDELTSYTCFHVVGDLVALLEVVAPDQDKVFVVGHDWGAFMAWHLCLFRPDKVKALLNLSVPYLKFSREFKPVDGWRAVYGNDYYICRFQEPGEMEAEFAEIGTERVIKEFLTYSVPDPIMLAKGNLFGHSADTPISLPSWLSQEEVGYYVTKFDKKSGFTGGINLYRNFNRNWELMAPWMGAKINVPAKFIVGDVDVVYHMPGIKEYIHNGEFKKQVPLLQEILVMEGVGHFINMEKANEINKHIYDFFRQFN
ncbi:Alpha/beta hydrolase-1 [Corchorus olitorius]|uniref:soluble epoxide hydrolase n=1 Tax=Corchorus olitorius TaxID=93759 RepID=A0A1R3GVM1_9ROSI|nr:Alpha/beta hydrolase-1 [Corchorus olitorius]